MRWPQRDALDKLLLSGASDEDILKGFQHGFGTIADKAETFAMARTPDYGYMQVQFKNGFGSQIMSAPQSNLSGIFAFLRGLCQQASRHFSYARSAKRPRLPKRCSYLTMSTVRRS